jgi:predicted dehydrogenase
MTTRREFTAQAAALTLAPFISTRVTRALAAASRRRIGIALCGLGNLSTYQLAPALQKTEFCRLAGIITGTPSKAVKWQSQYHIADRNIYNYETMHRIADDPDIDVVYVVTPNALHLDYALIAAKAGKHVLCEKPMEISVERCRQMIDAHFGFNVKPSQWRLTKALAGGGPLMDVGIYALQATRYLTGEEPVWISAATTQGDPTRFSEVEESVIWESKFPGGTISHCGSSYSGASAGYIRAIAERGWFGLEPAFDYGGIRGLRSDGKPIDMPSTDQFAVEMDDFARCILDKRATKVPGEEGLRDIRIMMAIYESAHSGRPVEMHTA